jgi:hypothetical protein
VTQVVGTPEFEAWAKSLSVSHRRAIARYVGLLEEFGYTLGFPYSSDIKGTSLPMRELRVKASGAALRVLYIFDPERNAVLLMGGDKSGDRRFYERMIKKVEAIYAQYLKTR